MRERAKMRYDQAMQQIAPYRTDTAAVPGFLTRTHQLGIVQRREIFEFFGFETRNKYSVH